MAWLTFSKGSFVLVQTDTYQLNKMKPMREHWVKCALNSYSTRSLRAAEMFREIAQEPAERMFIKALGVTYDQEINLDHLRFLDAHQRDGVRWILSRQRSYLAHAPGAGKTCQAIVASQLCEGKGTVVFIVPPALVANWERELVKFMGELKIPYTSSTIDSSQHKDFVDWKADFIIVPDSMLHKDWVLYQLQKLPIKFLAVDEASRFKEPASLRTVALFGGTSKDVKSKGLIYKPRHTVLMDGSPMPNRPMELWAPTFAMAPKAIDCLEQLDFGMRYCGPTPNGYGGWEFKYSSNEEELREKLRRDFMHVVTEEQLSHPERRRSLLYMPDEIRSREHLKWDKENLQGLMTDALDDDIKDEQLSRWRHELGKRKVPWATKYLRERLRDKNEKLLVFAWHKEVCFALHESLLEFRPGLVTGGTEAWEREEIFKDFQEGGGRLIIGNITAMGRGHNLQKADRVVFVEFSWCGETNIQAEKRASRRGSEKEYVRCEYLVAPGTIDEIVMETIFRKDASVKKIVG